MNHFSNGLILVVSFFRSPSSGIPTMLNLQLYRTRNYLGIKISFTSVSKWTKCAALLAVNLARPDLFWAQHQALTSPSVKVCRIYHDVKIECCLFLFRCKLRVVDSFGTEAQFNFNLYKEKLPGGSVAPFGRYNLNLRQFQTMFRKFLFTRRIWEFFCNFLYSFFNSMCKKGVDAINLIRCCK